MVEALFQFVEASRSLRLGDRARLPDLAQVQAVVFVGATCAGKSTLLAAVRAAAPGFEGQVDVPLRYITRPPRDNESPGENVHLSSLEFDQKVGTGEIGLHWTRELGPDRVERYGFAPTLPGALPVFSGNNALYSNRESVRPAGALQRALFVGVFAPDQVREARLRSRSQDLWRARPDEVAHRLAESSMNMLEHVHVVVANHGPLEAVTRDETVELVRQVAHAAKSRQVTIGADA